MAQATKQHAAVKTASVEDRMNRLESSLARIEASLSLVNVSNSQTTTPLRGATATKDVTLLKRILSELTIKRHAVLTATLGGVSYAEIAKIIGVDVSTVKLSLRATLQILDIPSREALLVSHRKMLDPIEDAEYESTFSVSKRWWLEQKPDLMDVLRNIKPANNQYN